MTVENGKGALRREVVRGVYFQDGETTVALMDEETRRLREYTVPEWHYQLLDAEGFVMSHGDHYFDIVGNEIHRPDGSVEVEAAGDHVRSALAGLLDAEEIPYEEGEPGVVHEIDAMQGKHSRTGRPHCPNCGRKLVDPSGKNMAKPGEWHGQCPTADCDQDLGELNPVEGSEVAAMLATPSLMVAMLGAIWAFLASMFASLSNYSEDAIANAYGNHTAFDVTQSYTKLHTGDPGEDGTSNAAGETTRKSTSYGASSGGVITTDADLAWTNVASSETYAYVSQWDASVAGNCLGSGALTASKAVVAADNFTIPSGSQTVTIT